ncbi:hypothetical protein H257_09890 [Aphanomyces astaci]|uniref:General transcription and DNA repair factor IIH subunit TFB5 n=1 Tax=Aphanomyces astaci TaxID=112090 RepID=W4GA36_APHAT|nr:hypothetical protein H257_09890 [Aphanomyces astaci]ETV75929.1 hypothetical protein H257_09890 [Aphanomyces astaci]|eukprot:XP_009834571.1 hypothetical protein H257_09890 [Aphanomyces astaci]
MASHGRESIQGVLVTCDPPTKQYLRHLNLTPGKKKFIIQDLDDHHLFIDPDPAIVMYINEMIDKWNDKNTYQAPTN